MHFQFPSVCDLFSVSLAVRSSYKDKERHFEIQYSNPNFNSFISVQITEVTNVDHHHLIILKVIHQLCKFKTRAQVVLKGEKENIEFLIRIISW